MSSSPLRLVLVLSFAAVAAGCATHAEKPAVCDGKHRRPANPYGSVLPTAPLPAAAAPVEPKAPPGPLSRLDPRSTEPCGRPA